MNKRKKASYGKMKKMRGGDYMEPNKELKFGGPSKPRMRAAKGLSYEEWKKQNPNGTVTDYNREVRDQYSLSERLGGQMREDIISGNVRTPKSKKASDAATASGNRPTTQTGQSKKDDAKKSSGSSVKMDTATGRPQGSGRPAQSTSRSSAPGPGQTGTRSTPRRETPAPSRGGSYAEAKKRDPKLDSYIKQRKGLKKGTPEYNAVQNKINKAYGKGPTNRPTAKPAQKPKAAPASMKTSVKPVSRAIKTGPAKGVTPEALSKGMAETGLRQAGDRLKRSKTSQASPTTKKESRIMSRADKKVGKIQDRRAKAAGRKERRQGKQENRQDRRSAVKDARAEKRAEIRAARGKQPRKKAVTGMAVQAGGAALQGIGKLTDAIAGKETKFGKIANTVGSTATQVGGMMGGVPGAQNLVGGAMNAVPSPGGADAAAQPNAAQQPDPNAAANAPVENAANQPMKRGGKKRKKMGGKMKYKTGGTKGAKPDFLDMDKDGNKTESMNSALKDRRSKARNGGKKKR